MGIVLINPKTGTERYSLPKAPLNLLCLASVLEQEGISCKLLDMSVIKSDEKSLIRSCIKNSTCVGISAMTGTQILNGIKISNIIKEYDSDIPIIWGGVHPTLFPEQTIQNHYVDYVVRGEGEYTLTELVKAIEKGSKVNDVKGITYMKNGNIISTPDREFCNMEELPLPAWHLIDVENYISHNYLNTNRVLPVHASRGCQFSCAFCYNLTVNKRKFRSKSAEKTFDEIKYLVDKYHVDGIVFREDNFCTDVKRVKRISELVCQEKMDLQMACSLRADRFKDEELLTSLVKMGVKTIGMGAESGSQRMLELIDKNISTDDILFSAKQSKKYDFLTLYSFIIGIPTETINDIEATLNVIDNIKKINPKCDVTNINIYTPYPKNKLYDLSVSNGFVPPNTLEEWGSFVWDNPNLPWSKDSDIIKTINQVSVFALNEQVIDKIRKRNVAFNLAGYLLHMIEKFRWHNRLWSIPYELRLVRIIRKMDEIT